MSLEIRLQRSGGVLVLKLSGSLWVLDRTFQHVCRELIRQGQRSFLLDLADVDYLDSYGLGRMCVLYNSARENGGNVQLLNPNRRVVRLLNISKLDTIFRSFQSEAGAAGARTASPRVY